MCVFNDSSYPLHVSLRRPMVEGNLRVFVVGCDCHVAKIAEGLRGATSVVDKLGPNGTLQVKVCKASLTIDDVIITSSDSP
jgi:hypothetical protein